MDKQLILTDTKYHNHTILLQITPKSYYQSQLNTITHIKYLNAPINCKMLYMPHELNHNNNQRRTNGVLIQHSLKASVRVDICLLYQ